jgi:hypothetical protein
MNIIKLTFLIILTLFLSASLKIIIDGEHILFGLVLFNISGLLSLVIIGSKDGESKETKNINRSY